MSTPKSIVDIYESKTAGSKALAEKAQAIFPSGIVHDFRYQKPYGIYIDRAKGSRKWDVDGNEYIDYVGGHGAHILGHCDDAIVNAVQESIARGTQVGANTPDEIEYGALVKEMVPCAERVRFTMSGTESTQMALRLARAYTGKPKTIRFISNFHGWHDNVASGYASHFDGTAARGISSSIATDTTLVDPGDIDGVKNVLEQCDDVAAVILEPTGSHFGLMPINPDFLSLLREITAEKGVVLIFDEVVTGFRIAPGGAQEAFGVTPDMSTHAKIVAGGLPGGAVCGRKEILDILDFDVMADKGEEKIIHNGTFNANIVSARAGIEMLKKIRDTDVCEQANRFGDKLRKGMNNVLADLDLPWAVYGEFSGFYLFTNPDGLSISPNNFDPLDYEYSVLKSCSFDLSLKICLASMTQGIHLTGYASGWASGAHSDDDYEKTIEGYRNALSLLKKEENI